jgi:alpha-tubulin suppressor-like RCC1 family protein
MSGIRRHGVRVLAGLALAAAFVTPALAASPAQAATRSHLWDWGAGPLGLGMPADRTKPVPVHGLGTAPVKQVISNNGTVLVLLKDGTVWAWGSGPLGNGGGPSAGSESPVQVTALSGVTAIAATTLLTASFATLSTFYALRSDGTVWAWGDGTAGQLGDGSTANRYVPAPVTGLTGVTKIATGAGTAYALTTSARVQAWGAGTAGQLGNGSTANSDVPVQVSLADRVTQIASACGSAYAITGDRRVFAWGVNTDGQLGDGTRTNAPAPVLVRRLSHAAAVVPGCVDAYAIIQGTRSVMAWGAGAQGEMGDGHTATRLYPVAVTGLTGVTQLSTSYTSAYAVDSAGSVWAWGYGRQGNLGDGTNANSPVPVKVINITVPVTAVVPGQSRSSSSQSPSSAGWTPSWPAGPTAACGAGATPDSGPTGAVAQGPTRRGSPGYRR